MTVNINEVQESTLKILREIKHLLSIGEVERADKLVSLHISAIESDKKI